jgi:hypothetical protein
VIFIVEADKHLLPTMFLNINVFKISWVVAICQLKKLLGHTSKQTMEPHNLYKSEGGWGVWEAYQVHIGIRSVSSRSTINSSCARGTLQAVI